MTLHSTPYPQVSSTILPCFSSSSQYFSPIPSAIAPSFSNTAAKAFLTALGI